MRRPRGLLGALAVYRDRRILTIVALGFASGLPLALTLSTLGAWLATLGVAKTAIGLFALVGLPYALKFLWSPLIDGVRLPVLTARLGRRRGWAVATQAAVALAILALGVSDPAAAPLVTAALAVVVAFCAASQDIVVDALRIEILADREQGAGAAAIQLGYRLGMLASGAGALLVAEAFGWAAAFVAVAALVPIGTVAVLLSAEPAGEAGGAAATAGAWLAAHVVAPFTDFLARPSWAATLVFILLYKLGDAVAGVMANPFYIELGFSLGEIAGVSKLFGLGATLAGVVIGGAVVARLGILRALLVCGVAQMLSNLMFAVQAVVGHDIAMLMLTIGLENVSGGMGSAAFVAYLSSLCSRAFTATQYALLSSLTAVGRTMLSSSGGWLADRLDWVGFFVLSTALALPALVLLWWMMRQPAINHPR